MIVDGGDDIKSLLKEEGSGKEKDIIHQNRIARQMQKQKLQILTVILTLTHHLCLM